MRNNTKFGLAAATVGLASLAVLSNGRLSSPNASGDLSPLTSANLPPPPSEDNKDDMHSPIPEPSAATENVKGAASEDLLNDASNVGLGLRNVPSNIPAPTLDKHRKREIRLNKAHQDFINCQTEEPSEVLRRMYDLIQTATIICAADAGQELTLEQYRELSKSLSADAVGISGGLGYFILDKNDWPDFHRLYRLHQEQRLASRNGDAFSFAVTEQDRQVVLSQYSKAQDVLSRAER